MAHAKKKRNVETRTMTPQMTAMSRDIKCKAIQMVDVPDKDFKNA